MDSTERICYQGRCYALTLRMITSINTLPNIPEWGWRRTKPASSSKLRLQADDDVLVLGCKWSKAHPAPCAMNSVHVKIQIPAERFRCLSVWWLQLVTALQPSAGDMNREVLEVKKGRWILIITPVWARSPQSRCLFWIIALSLHTTQY